MSLALQLIQQASAEHSTISPLMYAAALLGIIPLWAYVHHILQAQIAT